MDNEYFWQNETVVLRAIREKDADILYEVLYDTALRMQAEGGVSLPITMETAEDMAQYAIEMTKQEKELWFAVADRENRMVGYAILGYINERDGNIQCDVTIFPPYRKKGYGRAAMDILLKYAFYERRLHKMNVFVMEGNEEGRVFLSAIGFTLEAYKTEHFYSHGRFFGQYYYGITREEFENPKDNTDKKDVVPDSTLGQLKEAEEKPLSILKDRPYFWQYEDILIRDMTEEDYMKNREMMFSAQDARFYDNDVKLPVADFDLTEKEEEHLHFGTDGNRIEFAVTDLQGNYVGNINLHSLDRQRGTFSISLYFLKKERRKGYATKAIALLMQYAFDELRLNKMNICVNEGNEASARVMRKVGCKVEGIWRENVYYDGKYVNVVLFGVTKDEFHRFLSKKD